MEAEAEAVDGRLKEAEAKEKFAAVPSLQFRLIRHRSNIVKIITYSTYS